MTLVAAQDTVQTRTQPFDGVTTTPIERTGAKFHGDTVERLEGVRHQHQLALRVDRSALYSLCVPGCANLQPAMHGVWIQKCRHADRLPGVIQHCEGQHFTTGLTGEASGYFIRHFCG